VSPAKRKRRTTGETRTTRVAPRAETPPSDVGPASPPTDAESASSSTGAEPARLVSSDAGRVALGWRGLLGSPATVSAAVTFVAALIAYVLTLAPTVTFEDSGELAAAAYNLGVPHSPGYPLWTMLGKLFTYLPLGDVSYRLNLMSAFFSALGAAFVAAATALVLGHAASTRARTLMTVCAVAAGLLAATARSTWEQSIITEVYGLNAAFVGLLLLLLVIYGAAATLRVRAWSFWGACLAMGLALTNHPTTVLLAPVAVAFVLVLNYRRSEASVRLRASRLLLGLAWLAAGLLPLLYLPLASRRDPVLDWGDPDTWTGFVRVLTRNQYRPEGHSGLDATMHELWTYLSLLWEQWLPIALVVAVVGFVALLLARRRFFWLAAGFFLAAAPLTTIVTDFEVDGASPAVNAEMRALVSVFYIPSYLVLAFACGVGLWWLAAVIVRAATKRRSGVGAKSSTRPAPVGVVAAAVLLAASLLIIVVGAVLTARDVSMRDYRFASAYAANIFAVAGPDSLVMGDRDQFVFPLMYAQMVEGQRPDVTVIDQELLRRSWYIEMLRNDRPQLMAAVKPQADAFLREVAPFEAGGPTDDAALQAAYIALIKAIVDYFGQNGRGVTFTYEPPAEAVADASGKPLYYPESLGVSLAARPTSGGTKPAELDRWLTPVDLSRLDFSGLADGTAPLERNAELIRAYYAQLMASRAALLSQAGRTKDAMAAQALAERLTTSR
jgi:hypothetical protein